MTGKQGRCKAAKAGLVDVGVVNSRRVLTRGHQVFTGRGWREAILSATKPGFEPTPAPGYDHTYTRDPLGDIPEMLKTVLSEGPRMAA